MRDVLNKKLVIRCDGGTLPEIGTGHIMRSLKLAEALVRQNIFLEEQIVFATQDYGPYCYGADILRKSQFNLHCIQSKALSPNSSEELNCLLSLNPNIVLFDRLATEASLVKGLKDASIITVSFEDLGSGVEYTDVTINAIFHDVQDKDNVLVGYQYLNLGAQQLSPSYAVNNQVKRVCLTFGGYDKRDLTSFVLKALMCVRDEAIHLDVIIGRLNTAAKEEVSLLVKDLTERTAFSVTVYQRPKTYYAIVAKADLAVVSGGLTVFEMACSGIPCIALPQYQHQLDTIMNLNALGVLILVSPDMTLSEENFRQCFLKLLHNKSSRQDFLKAGVNYIDGKGLDRVIVALKNVLNTPT